ncbi:MAG: phosphopyruvate hydratase [Candidatus Micrarchaeota archaeon]
MKIKRIAAAEMLDSRGTPTVECEIILGDNSTASAMIPSGMSTGSHEALEKRDGGRRFMGKGVLAAVKNINNKIAPKLIGRNPSNQSEIDRLMIELDGTENKSNLGANAILAVSLASARAGAHSQRQELFQHISKLAKRKIAMPVPFANIINGGLHAGGSLKIQEFMIAPTGARSFSEAVVMVAETYHALKADLRKKFGNSSVNVGDEGGFAPPIENTAGALDMICDAIDELGYSRRILPAIDAAASEFFKDGKYSVDGKGRSPGEMVDFYSDLAKKYKLVSIEDPFSEDDWDGFSELNRKFNGKVQIVTDDLTVTNPIRLQAAIGKKCGNCLLLKVNQIGTLSESISAAGLSFRSKWGIMVSHRSGETEDPFIADLAVGLGCRQIKLGAPARGERTAKYNRLLRIEGLLGKKAAYGWIR